MKKTKFEELIEKNNEYTEELAKLVAIEQEKLHLLTYEPCSFGEAIIDLWDKNSEVMKNEDIDLSLRLMQSMYIHSTINNHYQQFFDKADIFLEGELEKLFFDRKVLTTRVMH